MSTDLPFFDVSDEQALIGDEIEQAIRDVMRSGVFILGPTVEAFEKEIADYLDIAHAVAVNSGTDALVIGLRALGIGPGDEVITTPFTYVATAEAVSLVGAKVVFADIDPATFNLCPSAVAARITSRTRAIMPVHLFGHAADMDALLELAAQHDLRILEDTAQAMGGFHGTRRLGTIGNLGAFSFFPTKNLGAYGDGGLIATNDAELAATSRMLRVHGSRRKYHSEALGYNSRLDAIQAAILRVKLPHLDDWNALRREAAGRYTRRLEHVPGLSPAPHTETHVYHQYTLRVRGAAGGDAEGGRDHLRERLAADGIPTMVYYPSPLHHLPLYEEAAGPEGFPHAERAAKEVLSLPMWPHIGAAAQESITAGLLEHHQSGEADRNAEESRNNDYVS